MPDAVARVIELITTGPRLQFEDGTDGDHGIVGTRDSKELANLACRILSLGWPTRHLHFRR
jgi:hypothetical protein